MRESHRIYLVPGFFGFANLGELLYFSHVCEFLTEVFDEHGMHAEVIPVHTFPTASIRERARRLLEVVSETAGHDDGPIHIIGHSSGGLDVRLMVSPHAQLGEGLDVERLANRVRTVVTLATPHHGTPLATYFNTMFGSRILRLMSLSTMYVLRYGRLPLSFLLRLGGLLARADSLLRRANGVLDQLFTQLLGDLSEDRHRALTSFFNEVSGDQSLIGQLTPEGLDLFNAGTVDRATVRYGCVVTMAKPPTIRTRLALGPDLYGQVTHTAYTWLYRRNSSMPPNRVARLTPKQSMKLRASFGRVPTPEDNDGIVPTLSQPWGEVITAVNADHLDLIGHFDDRSHYPPHYDWLVTGSGFDRRRFERLWSNVASFIAEQR